MFPHKQAQAHRQYSCLGNSSAFLCLSLAQTNPDTNKPIIDVSTPTALPGSEFTFIPNVIPVAAPSPFHQPSETLVSGITMESHVLGRKNTSKHEKKNNKALFLHTSVVPSSPPPHPRAVQTGNGNDCFLSEAALKALLERQSHGGAAFLRSRQPLCDVRFKASPLPFHL